MIAYALGCFLVRHIQDLRLVEWMINITLWQTCRPETRFGVPLNIKVLGLHIIKIRRSNDHIIFIMEIPTPGKPIFILRRVPGNTCSNPPLRWRHNELDGVSNNQPHDCLLNRLFARWSKKTAKLRVTGLCVGNSPFTGEFPTHRVSYAENVSIWWRHHDE